MVDQIVVELRTAADNLDPAFQVRKKVFVEEQGVSMQEEMDGNDQGAYHALAWKDETPVGTARLREYDQSTAKVERVAVCNPHRDNGIGTRLMERMEELAAKKGYNSVLLHAQVGVTEFYEKLGYTASGDVFLDAGIEHVKMHRSLE